jgi:hypothetical protein
MIQSSRLPAAANLHPTTYKPVENESSPSRTQLQTADIPTVAIEDADSVVVANANIESGDFVIVDWDVNAIREKQVVDKKEHLITSA